MTSAKVSPNVLARSQPLLQALLEGALVPEAREAVAARVLVRLAIEHLQARS